MNPKMATIKITLINLAKEQYNDVSSDLHCTTVPNIPKIPEPPIPPLPIDPPELPLFAIIYYIYKKYRTHIVYCVNERM